MDEEKQKQITEEQMRKVGIKIIRQGDRIQLKIGKKTSELFPLEGTTQTYPFFVLAQWMSEMAVTVLAEMQGKQAVFSDSNKAAAKTALEDLGFEADTATTDRVIQQIHEDQFGGR